MEMIDDEINIYLYKLPSDYNLFWKNTYSDKVLDKKWSSITTFFVEHFV